MKSGSICPYCLARHTIHLDKTVNSYSCSSCRSAVPREYVENDNAPVEVISAVGFRGHGKTLYFSSLFYSMDRLASIWPGFYSFAGDERSLDTINDNITKLKNGELPPPNPASFPIPTYTRLSNVPVLGNRYFLFYDTGGESYSRSTKLIKYASFVKRSKSVIFIISPEDLKFDGSKMHQLLTTYIQGLTELGGKSKEQHILVVYTKGDLIGPKLTNWKPIRRYLTQGGVENLENINLRKYYQSMKQISNNLRKFTQKELGAIQFLSFAQDQFKSVEFSIVSSLGAKPVGSRLQVEINPKCIFDPLLWVAIKGLSPWKRVFLL